MNIHSREKLTKNFFEVADSEKKAEADDLVNRWKKWAQQLNINRFLARMITGRLNAAGPNGLSGVAALIARLRCRDLWTDRIYGRDTDGGKTVDTLYESTLEFVCRTTPKAFLRDLILSEIIITWYWNQRLAVI